MSKKNPFQHFNQIKKALFTKIAQVKNQKKSPSEISLGDLPSPQRLNLNGRSSDSRINLLPVPSPPIFTGK